MKKKTGHDCKKEDIKWNREPTLDSRGIGVIQWNGKCTICGRKVHEEYVQGEEIFATEDPSAREVYQVAREEIAPIGSKYYPKA